MHKRIAINKSYLLYVFLLVVPFFNIIVYRLNTRTLLVLVSTFIVISLIDIRGNRIKKEYLFFFLLFFIILTFITSYSLIYLNKSNFSSIRFFTLPIFVFIFYIVSFKLNIFLKKYYIRLLKYYIVIFALSVGVDYFILHSSLDISLQLMHNAENKSYLNRPFGITGSPSANSVLLVFFYSLLLSVQNKKNLVFFLMVTFGVLLQGSGSGYIAYFMLLISLTKNHKYIKYFLLLLFFALISSNIVKKISLDYINQMYQVFLTWTLEWINNINSYADILFGGVITGIDFGPIFLISRVGLIYFFLIIFLLTHLIIKSNNHFERMAIFILLIGNLHYPFMFYLLPSFCLPLLAYRILNNKSQELLS